MVRGPWRLFTVGIMLGTFLGITLPASSGHNWTPKVHYHNRSPSNPINVWSGQNTNDCFDQKLWWATERSDNDSWNYHTNTWFDERGRHSQNHVASVMFWSSVDGRGKTLAVMHGWSLANGGDGHQLIVTQGNVHVDNAELWACHTGDTPSNRADLWSVLAHEAGHYLVLNDLGSSDSACPNSNSRATMCTYVMGTDRQRTPNTTEDKSSANKAYP